MAFDYTSFTMGLIRVTTTAGGYIEQYVFHPLEHLLTAVAPRLFAYTNRNVHE